MISKLTEKRREQIERSPWTPNSSTHAFNRIIGPFSELHLRFDRTNFQTHVNLLEVLLKATRKLPFGTF